MLITNVTIVKQFNEYRGITKFKKNTE
jgi:hypothetical protein